MVLGGASSDGFVSISRMQNAALSRTEKSQLLASVQRSLDFPIAATQTRRSCDPPGGAGRQDVPTATDMDAQSDEEDLSYGSSDAYQKSWETAQDSPRKLNTTPRSANAFKGDGQVLMGSIDAQGSKIAVTPVTVDITSLPSARGENNGGRLTR